MGLPGVRTMLSTAKACLTRFRVASTRPAQHRLGGAQFHGELAVLLLQAVQLGGPLQGQQQLFRMPGLEQVLVDARLVDAGDDVLAVGVAGDDDAHRVGPGAAHFLEELDAAHLGHALVGEDDLDGLPFHEGPGFRRAGGGEDLEVLFQGAAQGLLGADLVVDDQDGGEGGHGIAEGCTSATVEEIPPVLPLGKGGTLRPAS
jgi:hypothetical protein